MRTILDTDRLILREMDPSDIEFVSYLLADPQVMRFWPRPFTRDESMDWIRSHQKRCQTDGCGYWLAIDKTSQTPVGQAGILMSEVEGVTEPALGYIFDRQFWGRGLATEASIACVDWVFRTRSDPRVLCLIRPENIPSLRVAFRLRLTPERHVDYKGLAHLVFSRTREPTPNPSTKR